MRKFSDVFKEKQQISENQHEAKVVDDFKRVYNALLECYNLTSITIHRPRRYNVNFLTYNRRLRYWRGAARHGGYSLGGLCYRTVVAANACH